MIQLTRGKIKEQHNEDRHCVPSGRGRSVIAVALGDSNLYLSSGLRALLAQAWVLQRAEQMSPGRRMINYLLPYQTPLEDSVSASDEAELNLNGYSLLLIG
jgi:hypothetical protein